jgi:hypothetical protein
MVFDDAYGFKAPYLLCFAANCERLHRIVFDGSASRPHEDDLSDLYMWTASQNPLWSLSRLEVRDDGGGLDL